MKNLLRMLLLFSLIASQHGYAQNDKNLRVKITTTNGDIINGYIKPGSIPSKYIVFHDPTDSIIINANLVQSINLSRFSGQEITSRFNNSPIGRIKLKYFNNTMIGVLSGNTSDDSQPEASLSAETVNGVIIYRYLAAGIGIAYDQFNTTATLPFFFTLRGDILTHPFTPFYFADVGYGPAWDSREGDINWDDFDVEGGLMFHSGIGFKMYSDHSVNVMIAIGYKVQKTVYSALDWSGGTRVTDRTYKRLSLRIGIGF